jgi:hypothetical protein
MGHSLSYITIGIWIHVLVISPLIFVVFLKLRRNEEFHWLSAGFWALGSMALYFLITPLIQSFGNPYYLETRLAVTEGLSRMLWVTFCIFLGMSVFFLAYFNTRPGRPNFGLRQDAWPRGTWVVIILSLMGAAYSMIKYRGSFGFEAEQVAISWGKYVGQTTGYATAMQWFASFPIVLLLMRRSTRILGYGILALYLVGRLGDPWNRTSAVSLVLAVTMIATALRGRKWPPRLWIAVLLAFTMLMWARGHMSFTTAEKSGFLTQENLGELIKKGDTLSVLPTLYLRTYIYDKIGYTYGINLASQLLFGALPRKYFPWKDWLTKAFQGPSVKLPNWRKLWLMSWGAKATVIGDLYGCGNIIGILLGMPLLGFLTRKLDGFVAPEAPVAVRALGYVWLGSYYMIYGSELGWGGACVYLLGIPFLGVVLCGKILGSPQGTPAKPEAAAVPRSKYPV